MGAKLTIIEGNSNDKDNVRVIMVKGEKGEQGDLNHNDIIDNLTSNNTNKVLSAKQGKILKGLVDSNTTDIATNEAAISNNANNIENEEEARLAADNNLQNQINGLASGSPKAASSTAEMTDTSKTYVNTTDGNWYYYNGTAWVIGGVYQATSVANNSITPLQLADITKTNSFIKINPQNINYTPNNTYNGALQSSTDSITSGDYILMPKNSVIELLNTTDYKVRVSCFDLSKNFVKHVGYVSNDVTLDDDYFVLISISNVSGNRPLLSDISSIVNFEGYIQHNNISNNYQDLSFVKKEDIASTDYEVGTITNGLPTPLVTRVRTKEFHRAYTGDIININCELGIDIAIYAYDLVNQNYIETLYEWTTPDNKNIIIPYNCYIKWILRSHKNSNISTANDISNFNNIVTVYKNIQTSLGIEQTEIQTIISASNIYQFSAHRGYFKYGAVAIPENTIAAYKYAKSKGFDFIETDVRMTSDHIPIICHDDTINRTARNLDGTTIGTTISVADNTYDDLDQYDYGIYVSQEFAGTPLLTFDEVCKFAKFNNIKINIDCKATANSDIDIIYSILRKYGMQYQVRWTVASSNVVNYLLSLNPKLEIALGAWNPTVNMVTTLKQISDNYPLAKLSVDFYTLNISNDVYTAIKNNDVVLSCYCESDNQIIQAANYGATYMTVNLNVPYELLKNNYNQ